MILVTGATGGLGKATIEALLRKVSPTQIAGMARDVDKASALTERGVVVRQGDYFSYESMVQAFTGVKTLVLVSAPTFSDRETQHHNAIKAAKDAGVSHVIFTSIQRKENSRWIIPMVTESDKDAEQKLKESGLDYTIVLNNIYTDVLDFFIGDPTRISKIEFPAGDGKISFVTRVDFGEALANIATQQGHKNKTYTLSNSEALSFAQIAAMISELRGQNVEYVNVSREAYIDAKVALGFPRPVAAFAADWADAVRVGELGEVHLTAEQILGRKPATLKEYLKANFAFPESPGSTVLNN